MLDRTERQLARSSIGDKTMSNYQEYQAVDSQGKSIVAPFVANVFARRESSARRLINTKLLARGLQDEYTTWRQGGYKLIVKDC